LFSRHSSWLPWREQDLRHVHLGLPSGLQGTGNRDGARSTSIEGLILFLLLLLLMVFLFLLYLLLLLCLLKLYLLLHRKKHDFIPLPRLSYCRRAFIENYLKLVNIVNLLMPRLPKRLAAIARSFFLPTILLEESSRSWKWKLWRKQLGKSAKSTERRLSERLNPNTSPRIL